MFRQYKKGYREGYEDGRRAMGPALAESYNTGVLTGYSAVLQKMDACTGNEDPVKAIVGVMRELREAVSRLAG